MPFSPSCECSLSIWYETLAAGKIDSLQKQLQHPPPKKKSQSSNDTDSFNFRTSGQGGKIYLNNRVVSCRESKLFPARSINSEAEVSRERE